MDKSNKLAVINTDHPTLTGFSERQKAMILARSETKIIEIEQDTIEELITNLVQRTFIEYGRRKPTTAEELDSQTQDDTVLCFTLINDLKRDFKALSMKDVDTAFSMGVRGEFGKIMGLNIRTFYQWLKEYNKERVIQVKRHHAKMSQQNQLERSVPVRPHLKTIEQLEKHHDFVVTHIFETKCLPLVVDWLSIFYFLNKTDQVDLKGKRKKQFDIYFLKYLNRSSSRMKDAKTMEEAIKDHRCEITLTNHKRSAYAKFHIDKKYKPE